MSKLLVLALSLFTATIIVGCEGTVEENVDKTEESVEKAVEKTKEVAGEVAKESGKMIEAAGDEIEKATDKLTDDPNDPEDVEIPPVTTSSD
ncbi:hypothetical protein [Rubinisphaera sp.]|uniref:hypothetical protein n=1 Tax=Rubinisphaera sp. TaxID=2024857 RepID=UPI000C0D4984|nr:hypothetical protein [Rubinisphaera sp.]MBV10679.1 hypothetical protein [Rubinisphaera sp.]HCS52429.1 hypothetical protein [Planctomycetaceae bacterium]|tara:strand:+ start:956 stop:1231 length:276 start_codon:yes stop_codon:yes gene_type:complete